ncbi:MAG: hypothetical protein SNJ84_02640 [Verrucomicrobiia bacterium]
MAWQLIFTSAPRGLLPGRTGLVTVARHRELDEGLVTRLERWSVYDRARFGTGPGPEVFALRRWERGGVAVYVLTRMVDAGADYSGRANHVAHHLIVGSEEVAKAREPTEVALGWEGWLNRWEGGPRWLGEEDWVEMGAMRLAARGEEVGPIEGWVEGGQAVSGEARYPVGKERVWVATVGAALRRVEGNPWDITWASVGLGDGEEVVWRGRVAQDWGFSPLVAGDPRGGRRVRAQASGPARRASRERAELGDGESVEIKDFPGERLEGTVRERPSGEQEREKVRTSGWKVGSWLVGGGLVVAMGLGVLVWSMVEGRDGERWAEETRELMRAGNVGAVEDRLRLFEQGGQVVPGVEQVVAEVRWWVAAERAMERLSALRLARDEVGVERLLAALEAEPELVKWRRVAPRLGRSMEDARLWLEGRRIEVASARTAVERAEEAVGEARGREVAEARVAVERLGGEAGSELRSRLERLGEVVEEAGEGLEKSGEVAKVERAEVSVVVSPAGNDGSVWWSGGPLSRMVLERLWSPEGVEVSAGVLGAGGVVENGERGEVVRTGESLKLYRGMDLLAEVRRAGAEGLGWRPNEALWTETGMGWWFRLEGGRKLEIRFVRPTGSKEEGAIRLGLTDLLVDGAVGQGQVSVDGVKLREMVPVVAGKTVMVQGQVRRGGRIVAMNSRGWRAGVDGWEGELRWDLWPGDEVVGGVVVLRESGEGGMVWNLVEFGEGRE